MPRGHKPGYGYNIAINQGFSFSGLYRNIVAPKETAKAIRTPITAFMKLFAYALLPTYPAKAKILGGKKLSEPVPVRPKYRPPAAEPIIAPHIGVLYRRVIPYMPGSEMPGTILEKAQVKAKDFKSVFFVFIPTARQAVPWAKFEMKKQGIIIASIPTDAIVAMEMGTVPTCIPTITTQGMIAANTATAIKPKWE